MTGLIGLLVMSMMVGVVLAQLVPPALLLVGLIKGVRRLR